MPTLALATCLVLIKLPESSLARIQATFKTLHYYPPEQGSIGIPPKVLAECQVIFSTWKGLPFPLSAVPRLVHLQLSSAGVDKALQCPALQEIVKSGQQPSFTLANSSGIHAISVASWVVMQTLALYQRLPELVLIARNECRWAAPEDIMEPDGTPYRARTIRGKTVGMLGYGHLGRESARLLSAFGVTIIAANTSGCPRTDEGWVLPGTGDREGSIPSTYYSTADPASFEAFLRRSDILVASLPSTGATRYLLDSASLAFLPPNAILLNVGRGDLVSSDHLLEALDRPGGLGGAALDVTDPEPLPRGHPLFNHARVIITPHCSGDLEGEFETSTELFLANVDRFRKGNPIYNKVNIYRGY